jgi:hypothetical protein
MGFNLDDASFSLYSFSSLIVQDDQMEEEHSLYNPISMKLDVYIPIFP